MSRIDLKACFEVLRSMLESISGAIYRLSNLFPSMSPSIREAFLEVPPEVFLEACSQTSPQALFEAI